MIEKKATDGNLYLCMWGHINEYAIQERAKKRLLCPKEVSSGLLMGMPCYAAVSLVSARSLRNFHRRSYGLETEWY